MRSIGVCGSRDFENYRMVRHIVTKNVFAGVELLISGGCPNSPDEWAEDQAYRLGIDVVSYRPCSFDSKWRVDRYLNNECLYEGEDVYPSKRDACFARNAWITFDSDKLLAFWDGYSNGTYNTIKHSMDLKKDLAIYYDRT